MMQSNIDKIKAIEKSSNQEEIEMVFNKNKTRGFKYLKISKDNTKLLEDCFAKSIYPSKETYCELSSQTKLPITKIENWFKFQRKKHLGGSENVKYQKRRILRAEEERILEERFRDNQNPTYETLRDLALQLQCKKKQVRNWFAYRRKKLNRLRRKRGGINKESRFFKGSKKEQHKADSSSLESNKIFLEDKNSTSSTSNQNTKKELSNNESSENKVNSYDSQMKTELANPYALKNSGTNPSNSQEDNNLTQTENKDQKMGRMGNPNQPIYFSNAPYYNQQFNPIYYNNSYNPNPNSGPIFINSYPKFAYVQQSFQPQPQYQTYNMLVPVNHPGGMNVGYYPVIAQMPQMTQINQMGPQMGQNMSQMNNMGQNMSQMNNMGQNMSQKNPMGQNMSQINPMGQNMSQMSQNISQMNNMGQNQIKGQMNQKSQMNSMNSSSLNSLNSLNTKNTAQRTE